MSKNNIPPSRPHAPDAAHNIAPLAPIMAQDDFKGAVVTNALSFAAWDRENGTGRDKFTFYVVGTWEGYCLDATFCHPQRRRP
ncbi:hypothetical protein F5146DRAFT_1135777 [Armillaria mellea]|nr:hypothetical protein F5146DRAFT_1135777 [Armillaria mellea]